MAVVACLSVPFGLSLGRSAMYIIRDYSKVLVFGFLLIAAIRGVRDLATIVWGYVIGCGALAWLSMFVFDLSLSFDSYAYRLNDLYGFDANDVGCIMLIGLALALLLVQASKGYSRIVAGIILVAIGATIAKTGSRGAFVGIVAVGAYLLVALKTISPIKRIAFVIVVGAALVFAAPPGYWEQMKTLANPMAAVRLQNAVWDTCYSARSWEWVSPIFSWPKVPFRTRHDSLQPASEFGGQLRTTPT